MSDAWISVRDKKPENNSRVFICLMDDINEHEYPYEYEDAVEVGFYQEHKDKWYSDTRADYAADPDNKLEWQDVDVTHWAPLFPKPQ